jgi:hypothetical protein
VVENEIPWRAAFRTIDLGTVIFWDINLENLPPRHHILSLEPSSVASSLDDLFLERLPLGARFWVVPWVDVALLILENSTKWSSVSLTQSPQKATIRMFSSSWKWKWKVISYWKMNHQGSWHSTSKKYHKIFSNMHNNISIGQGLNYTYKNPKAILL